MEVQIKNRNDLLELCDNYRVEGKSTCNHSKFDEWSKIEKIEFGEFVRIGFVNLEIGRSINTNYWGKGSPIEIDKYPYSNCEIYLCPNCNGKFFYYIEDGGHSAEKRLRRIQRNAIINRSQEYYMNLAIPHSIDIFHEIIKTDLNFPNFYGANWDAFWDTITGIVELPNKVIFYNYNTFLTNWNEKAKPLEDIVKNFNSSSDKEMKLINGMVKLL